MRIDIRVDISIYSRSMATKFDKQVHLGEFTKMILVKQVLVTGGSRCFVTSRSCNKLKTLYLSYQSAYDHQIWLGRMVTYLNWLNLP